LKKNLHFLAGIPRSGSTVLAAILNQNKTVHVSTTSGLVHVLNALAVSWHSTDLLNKNDLERKKLAQTMRGTIDAFYENVSAPIIVDKSRGWSVPMIMQSMNQVLDREIKIIATVRSIPDCAASFVRIAKPENLDTFLATGQLIDHLKAAYISLQSGYEQTPNNFLFVEYDDLVSNPKKQLDRIHEFLGLATFEYNFNDIDGSSVTEDDENLHGFAGMHDIKPVLEAQHKENPKDILKHHYSAFCQPEFWLDKPRTIKEVGDLDLQLASATIGDFAKGWELALKLEKEEPDNNRAAFNRGWYYLRQGQIQKGYQLMDRGRIEGVFGNSRPDVPTQQWDGKSKGIVLLYLEGGLGDQIHQVRYAKNIAQRGCKVVVSCTGQLASLFVDVEGVSSVVQHEAVYGVYHNFWVAGMSAVVPLGFELSDLDGSAYITKPSTIKGYKKRIGLRWQGNSQFEHEHHKKFPYELMFEAVKNADAEFISLQRDEAVDVAPSWVKTVPLNTWEDTRNAVASCDLVISACTSVSHLSAAMGVPTWVVTPVMPYFLYAIEGAKTPYYNSMKIIRQETFDNWDSPFDKITKELDFATEKIRRIK
jgi:hypothetical protein